MDNITEKKQMLYVENRKKLEMDGVINVASFTEEYLELSTVLGELSIEGKNLKIEELCQENGKIKVVGDISGVFYRTEKPQKGIFGGLFK